MYGLIPKTCYRWTSTFPKQFQPWPTDEGPELKVLTWDREHRKQSPQEDPDYCSTATGGLWERKSYRTAPAPPVHHLHNRPIFCRAFPVSVIWALLRHTIALYYPFSQVYWPLLQNHSFTFYHTRIHLHSYHFVSLIRIRVTTITIFTYYRSDLDPSLPYP